MTVCNKVEHLYRHHEKIPKGNLQEKLDSAPELDSSPPASPPHPSEPSSPTFGGFPSSPDLRHVAMLRKTPWLSNPMELYNAADIAYYILKKQTRSLP